MPKNLQVTARDRRSLSALLSGKGAILSILAGCAALTPGFARAQSMGPLLGVEIPFDINRGHNVSVTERDKPELAPQGVPFGALRLYPSLTVGGAYSSNVYGATNGKIDDVALLASPAIELRSDWSRHSLRIRASGDFRRFANQTIRNEDGYIVSTEGTVDIVGESQLYGFASIQRAYEAQYSGSFPSNSASTVPVTRITGIMRGTFAINRFRLIANLDVNDLNYSDNEALNGAVLDEDYRDRSVIRASARGEYALSPDAAAFIQGSYSDSSYRHALVGQPQRDSREARVLAGFTFDLTDLVRAAIGVGYVHRDYQSSFYPSLSDVAVDARIEYFLTPITTITLGGRRAIEDSIVGPSPGYVATTANAQVDHELLRNLILTLRGGYERDSFKNITRRDRQFRIGGGANYTLFRNLVLEPGVEYIDRNSTGAFQGQSFNEFQAKVKATYRM